MKKLFVIGFTLTLFITLLAGCAKTGDSSSKNSASNENTDDITFDNVISSTTMSITTVNGEVKNNGTKACSFTLKVSFYDKDDKLLGSAAGAVNDLNGGETTLFSAIATGDYSGAASRKVQVDTVVGKKENKNKNIEFSNLVAQNTLSMTTVDGEAKNTDTAELSFTLMVGAYGNDGKLLGVATGAVNNLAASETKTFTAIFAEDMSAAKEYRAFVGTIVS